VIDFVADPLGQELIRRALLEVLLISVAGGALGCWIVLYGVSYAAESLSHSMFPGLVIAALAGAPILVGGAPAIVLAALAIAVVGRVRGVGRDTAVAVVVTGLFGLGALLALSAESPPGVQGLLFGDILAPSDSDLILAAALALAVLVALRGVHWPLLAVAFDRTTSPSLGVSPTVADATVLALLAAAALVTVQGLGTLLAVAMLVGPAATARTFTRRLPAMMLASTLLGLASGIAGIYISFHAGLAAGASIAGCIVVAYLVAIAIVGARSAADRLAASRRLRVEAAT
jgi:ABC-type Mn2+/Zn2+ transport system permease subunit